MLQGSWCIFLHFRKIYTNSTKTVSQQICTKSLLCLCQNQVVGPRCNICAICVEYRDHVLMEKINIFLWHFTHLNQKIMLKIITSGLQMEKAFNKNHKRLFVYQTSIQIEGQFLLEGQFLMDSSQSVFLPAQSWKRWHTQRLSYFSRCWYIWWHFYPTFSLLAPSPFDQAEVSGLNLSKQSYELLVSRSPENHIKKPK